MSKVLKLRLAIFLLDVFDLIAFLFFVIGIVLTVRFFIFNPFTVVGQSMESTFSQWDFIIVDKVTPKYWTLEKGDILVFVPEGKDVPFIKRVIGVAWETIVVEDGDMYVCGDDVQVVNNEVDTDACSKLDEPYLDEWMTTLAKCNKKVFPINEWYFMVWDNRNHSTDSRCCFGASCYDWASYTVSDKEIIWKVAVRLYPSVDKF